MLAMAYKVYFWIWLRANEMGVGTTWIVCYFHFRLFLGVGMLVLRRSVEAPDKVFLWHEVHRWCVHIVEDKTWSLAHSSMSILVKKKKQSFKWFSGEGQQDNMLEGGGEGFVKFHMRILLHEEHASYRKMWGTRSLSHLTLELNIKAWSYGGNTNLMCVMVDSDRVLMLDTLL